MENNSLHSKPAHQTAMNLFTDHPASVNETYTEHAGFAFGFGLRMIVGGLACCLHGLFPFLFERTGSRIIGELNQRLADHRPVASETSAKLA